MYLHLNAKTTTALLAAATLASAVHAACPSWPTASRFAINGAEVKDNRTGLTWARCSAGQSWSGSACTGTASTYTHEQALQYAAGQSGWRLPTVKELTSLADRGCQNPAIDTAAFPNTPSNSISMYWSSSPHPGKPGDAQAWHVSFYDGGAGSGYGRNYASAVRLVRASQ